MARLLIFKPRCRPSGVTVDVNPPVHDEPVTAQHQHVLARVVQHCRHRYAPHPEHVLRERHVIRKLDVRQANADVRRIVDYALAVYLPFMRISHVPTLPVNLEILV